MISEKDRTHFVAKIFIAVLVIVLITIYNSFYYNELITFDTPHLKLEEINTTVTEIIKDAVANTSSVNNSTRILSLKPIPKGYLVWSENCHMPTMDPFAPHYRSSYKSQLLKHYDVGPNCTEKPRLIEKYFNKTTKSYVLHINMTLKDQYLNSTPSSLSPPTESDIDCCYRKVIRNGDKKYKLLDCKDLAQEFQVPNDIDYLTIECREAANSSNIIYKDGMSFIQERSTVNEKFRNNTKSHRPFGILLFGIDTLSQFNFRRVMPKTFKYVEKDKWFELSGYNKQVHQIMFKRKKKHTQIVINALVACFLVSLLIVYNNIYYDILTTIHMKRIKLMGTPVENKTTATTTPPPIIAPPEGYLVWSENCHMPSVDPLNNDYMTIYERDIVPNCTETQPLITKSYNGTLESYVLNINMNLKDEYINEADENIECCYKEILRKGDTEYELLDCEPLQQDFIVPNNIDHMLVECIGTTNTSVIYQDGLSFIQQRTDVNEKLQNNERDQRPFGILLFGIDTVSQLNIRRVMPETYAYVQNNSWFELSGYNKMEDNTFPNLMAIFTGLNLDQADEICHYHEPGGLDNCTTLFNLFNRQGMATAYSEDTCDMSTFDYLKPGFVKPPTDYYQRPLLLAIEKELPIKKLSGLQYCIGPRRYGEYVYDFGVEFAERFVGQSIFGLFWTNSFSHNDWIDPATMDDRMVEYFNYMDEKEILDNNVVILFSDHGARWGFLRNQKEGYIEERLPMFFMRLPQWFQDQNPELVHSLRVNKNRLTSPYDVHVTLKHLALLSLGKYEAIDLPISCPTCQTLFVPVLENRTCELAGIDDHWCTCTPFESLERSSELMENLTKLVIAEMNVYLNESDYGNKCAPLEFKRNVEANLKLDLHEDSHTSQVQTYRMNFEADPNEAAFDATFVYDTINKNLTVIVTEISRLNSYAKDSECIDDNIIKKYCICKDSIKSSS